MLHWSLLPQLLCASTYVSKHTGGTIPSSGPCDSPTGHVQLTSRYRLWHSPVLAMYSRRVGTSKEVIFDLCNSNEGSSLPNFNDPNVPKSGASSDKGLPPHTYKHKGLHRTKKPIGISKLKFNFQVSSGYLWFISRKLHGGSLPLSRKAKLPYVKMLQVHQFPDLQSARARSPRDLPVGMGHGAWCLVIDSMEGVQTGKVDASKPRFGR